MKRIVRLTERDITRIVRRVINEEFNDTQTLKIIEAKFKDFFRSSSGSYVTLSDGKTYQDSDGSMKYYPQCTPGTYIGKTLPEGCSVSITNLGLICDSTGCKKKG